eukprot:COSAG01_NODE_312_length_19063_cov_207.879825_16_plen_181_part_00
MISQDHVIFHDENLSTARDSPTFLRIGYSVLIMTHWPECLGRCDLYRPTTGPHPRPPLPTEISHIPSYPSLSHQDQNRRRHKQKGSGISVTALVLITMCARRLRAAAEHKGPRRGHCCLFTATQRQWDSVRRLPEALRSVDHRDTNPGSARDSPAFLCVAVVAADQRMPALLTPTATQYN